MSLRLLKFLVLAVFCTVSALAQMPIPYGPSVSVENAKKAAAAALDEARKGNWKMAVAVVDTGGVLVYYEKMDNTQIGSADLAIDKARTAVQFKRPSKAFQDLVDQGQPHLVTLDHVTAVQGGLPIVAEGKIIGAIGASGGTSAQDEQCAQAGLNTLGTQ